MDFRRVKAVLFVVVFLLVMAVAVNLLVDMQNTRKEINVGINAPAQVTPPVQTQNVYVTEPPAATPAPTPVPTPAPTEQVAATQPPAPDAAPPENNLTAVIVIAIGAVLAVGGALGYFLRKKK